MPRYAALLRAVNVGGTGKLPMQELVAMCERAGFQEVRTYIASGNAVFSSNLSAPVIKAALETQLETYAGKKITVFVRCSDELAQVLADNPFAGEDPKKCAVVFLDDAPEQADLENARGVDCELFTPGRREIYIFYPSGMGRSKLRIPVAEAGTARNMNTVAKLVEMTRS